MQHYGNFEQEKADTPEHILLHCPVLMGGRLRHLGTICPAPEEARSGAVVPPWGHRQIPAEQAGC